MGYNMIVHFSLSACGEGRGGVANSEPLIRLDRQSSRRRGGFPPLQDHEQTPQKSEDDQNRRDSPRFAKERARGTRRMRVRLPRFDDLTVLDDVQKMRFGALDVAK